MASSKPERHCLVTVGATVGFQTLTSIALTPTFWNVLHKRGFTSLRLQCGPDQAWASEQLSRRSKDLPQGFHVEVFDLRKNLMKEEMVLCKEAEGRKQGLIVSHAGKQRLK
jgi:beta-1,4-N-acetylglucosaminyltransferase